MAVVIVNRIEGGDQEFYEQINPKVMPGASFPTDANFTSRVPWRTGGESSRSGTRMSSFSSSETRN